MAKHKVTGPERKTHAAIGERWCHVCEKWLSITLFRKAGRKPYLKPLCVPCGNKKFTQWRNENPEKYATIKKSTNLKRAYGITLKECDAMLLSQKGCCAICPTNIEKNPVVDHDHSTGKVRGLLCHSCNLALGGFKDDPGLLRLAAAYLERTAYVFLDV